MLFSIVTLAMEKYTKTHVANYVNIAKCITLVISEQH